MGLWVIKAEGCYWLIKGLTLDAFLWLDFYSCIAVPKWPEFTSPLQAEILFPLNIQEKSPRAVLEKSVVVKCMLEEACRRVDTHTHTTPKCQPCIVQTSVLGKLAALFNSCPEAGLKCESVEENRTFQNKQMRNRIRTNLCAKRRSTFVVTIFKPVLFLLSIRLSDTVF